MKKIDELELAMVEAAFRRSGLLPRGSAVRVGCLSVQKRAFTGAGVITDYLDSGAVSLVSEKKDGRLGAGLVAMINETVLIGSVVYVDNGRISAVELSTFGGELWPGELSSFDIVDDGVEGSE